ncbi:MAG: DUF2868 domain-containing protein [Verrucomicrobiota bacterium]
MSEKSPRWTLESLVDFEQAAATSIATPPTLRSAVNNAIRGQQGATARRYGLRVWLAGMPRGQAGKKFLSALALVTVGLSLTLFFTGISSVVALMDRRSGSINVVQFLAIFLGGQWLVLLLAAIAWAFRRRAAEGFSGVQALFGKLACRLAGNADNRWWQAIMEGGGMAREALLWRLARMAQTAGMAFNLGILCGLLGLVMVKQLDFYWESTTRVAMRSILDQTVNVISAPWAAWYPDAVPDAAMIEATRRLPARPPVLPPNAAPWWEFLLLATLFWGLLPRAILGLLAWRAERKALANLAFQGRTHRTLWREITGADRIETDEKPLDGVLVLDVGGSGLNEETLRPFLLRRLRVHPAAWKSVAVLDPGAEHEAALCLADAPAGIVLLAEGWALSPPRMRDLHGRIRATAGAEILVKFLVANVTTSGQPTAASSEERHEWERFVDGLRDPAAEIHFYETLQPVL